MFVGFAVLFISIITTNGVINNSTIRFHNHSVSIKKLSNQTITFYAGKKSNSIELLKKLLANRQSSTKYNSKLLLTNTTHKTVLTSSTILYIQVKPTVAISNSTHADFLTDSPLNKIIEKKDLSNTTIFVIIFVCSFSGLAFLLVVCTFFLRQPINSSYFKLPCIHTLSTAKQSRDSTPSSYSPIHRKFSIPGEFHVDDLYDIYMQKHALDDLVFSTEFQSIPNFEELPSTSATRDIVASKNRFLNILPIDTTRVVLNLLDDDPATDYINGNYISGYKCPNKFIATQGPKPDTCEDFWRMIWELEIKSIVMLTNIIEGASRMVNIIFAFSSIH
ncbi:unnamed protein product [Rotaria magnacalcarata]|nr:unnamed protein product [Rotaria magnacalcarata]